MESWVSRACKYAWDRLQMRRLDESENAKLIGGLGNLDVDGRVI
jgi:hypothetical protein